MRIKSISFSRLCVTKRFENERVGITVELGAKDDPNEAMRRARRWVAGQLGQLPTSADVEKAKATLYEAGFDFDDDEAHKL